MGKLSGLVRHRKFDWGEFIAFCCLCFVNLAAGSALEGSFSPIATGSNVDLTMTGKLDWVHWGLYTDSSITRKSGVSPAISDFSLLGTGVINVYQYSDNYNGYTWFDGSPTVEATNTTTGVWAYQAYPPTILGSGFQFTVPADTNWNQLQVFVGTFAARGLFKATLSDGTLAYSDNSLFNSANGPGGVYTLNYKASIPNQTLTVQWTLSQRAAGTNSVSGNVTLQAAALTATNANNPPFVTLTNPTNLAAFAAPANIAMAAVAEDFDGMVTNVVFYDGTNFLGQTAAGPYSFEWSNAPVGHYFLSAKAEDELGGSRVSPAVEIFVYGSGGSLSGSNALPSPTVDLTLEGTADWMHWGLTNTSVDRKAGVTPQLSTYSAIGTKPIQGYADNYTSFSWTDGMPTLLVTNTPTGVFITGLSNGFQLTLPADPIPRTARIYVGLYGAQASFEAYLSDLSAPPFTDSSLSNEFDNAYAVYNLAYASASPGQTLKVIYQSKTLYDFDFGNVTLQAATLEGGPVVPHGFAITNAVMLGRNFALSFNTRTGINYTVQFSDNLSGTNWSDLQTVPGDGALMSVTNLNVPTTQRYYRVLAQ
jgi:hypothetical protein